MNRIVKSLKLKPCPFCGSENLSISGRAHYEEMNADSGFIMISCQHCNGCDFSSFPHRAMSYTQAVFTAAAGWNRRAA